MVLHKLQNDFGRVLKSMFCLNFKNVIDVVMCVIEYNGAYFIKKLQLAGKYSKAISLNSEYEPWNIEHVDLLHIVGKVKAAICKV